MRHHFATGFLLAMLITLGFGCAGQSAQTEPVLFKAVVFERSGGIAGQHDVLRINADRSYAFDQENAQPVARLSPADFDRLMERMSAIDWQTLDREFLTNDGAADHYTYTIRRVFQQGKNEILEPGLVCTDVGLNHCPRDLRQLIYVLQATRSRLER